MSFLDPLEPRRFLAADLIPVTFTVNPTLAYPATAASSNFVIQMTIRNIGNAVVAGNDVNVHVHLTTDKIIGNDDDIVVDVNPFDALHPLKPVTQLESAPIPIKLPADTPVGDYYVAIFISEHATVLENTYTNNTMISDKTLVTTVNDVLPEDSIGGTLGNDNITIERPVSDVFVTVNGQHYVVPTGADRFFINGQTGNDRITAVGNVGLHLQITGAGGYDTIIGGEMSDELSGANGRDKVYGGKGNDYLLGGAQSDYLNGGLGNDTMSASGGNDRCEDTTGIDYLIGGNGDDVLLARDAVGATGQPDTLSGNTGDDDAQLDPTDTYSSILHLLP